MLAFAAAAAIPVVLHLWNRRRRQTVDWAAMQFLVAALKKRSRRMRIEQLSLLALRTLVMLLFAAIVADPFLPRGGAWADATSGDRTHWILVLDASFSMQRREDDGNAFERALRRADEIVSAAPRGDGFSVVLMSDAAISVVGAPSFDAAAVREELQSLEALDGGANLDATLGEVERLALQAARESPRLTNRSIVFLTDLQKRTWDAAAAPTAVARLEALAKGAELSILDVGSNDAANLAVARLAPRDSIVLAGRPTVWEAEIRNLGAERRSTAVSLAIDGEVVESKRVDVPPGEQAQVLFEHRFDEAGARAVEVRLSGDSLPPDDVRRYSAVVRDRLRILLVGEDARSRFFLSRALDPLGDGPLGDGGLGIAVDGVGPAALAEADLSDYDAVFVSNLGRFADDEAVALKRFVGQGGGLALFPGPAVDRENWNRTLGSEGAGGLLPARLGEVLDGDLRLSATSLSHPLAAAFRGNAQSGLFRIPTWRRVALQPQEGEGPRVALAFESGEPALVEKSYRAGRVALSATAGFAPTREGTGAESDAWTVIPAVGDFVSLVQETVRFLVEGAAASRNVRVGDPLVASASAGIASDQVAIVRPDGARVRLEGEVRRSGETTWTFGETRQAGFYDLVRDSRENDLIRRFAVDVDLRESDLARTEVSALPPVFDRVPAKADATDAATLDSRPVPLFPILIAVLLALVGLEAFLAWKLGSNGAPASAASLFSGRS
jgi:hypothetical protein